MTLRARGRRRVREIPSGDIATLAGMSDQANPERSDPDLLGAALARLPVDQRTILVLHHLEGQGVAEIAEVLEIPVGTVKSRLPSGSSGPPGSSRGRGSQAMTQPDWDDDRLAAAFHARFDRPAPPTVARESTARSPVPRRLDIQVLGRGPARNLAAAAVAVLLVGSVAVAVADLGRLGGRPVTVRRVRDREPRRQRRPPT